MSDYVDSDSVANLSWSESDGDDGPRYSSTHGTVVWREKDAREIPILTQDNVVSTESYGGLLVHVITPGGRYENWFQKPQGWLSGTRMMKARVPMRTDPFMSREKEILVNQGADYNVVAWAAHYSRDEVNQKWLRSQNWYCVLDFHPNLIRTEIKPTADDKHPHSVLQTVGILLDDTLQALGPRFDDDVRFPTNPAFASGMGVSDPTAYRWQSEKMLPRWLTENERTNSMGFMRMTTYLGVSDRTKNNKLKHPPGGSYAFHVLIIVPQSSTFLRAKLDKSIKKGKYLQNSGKRYHFAGHLVGMLNTKFLRDCPVHIQIPVIVPSRINVMAEAGSGEGPSVFERSFSTSPKKTRQADALSKGQAEPPSPTPNTRKANAKARQLAQATGMTVPAKETAASSSKNSTTTRAADDVAPKTRMSTRTDANKKAVAQPANKKAVAQPANNALRKKPAQPITIESSSDSDSDDLEGDEETIRALELFASSQATGAADAEDVASEAEDVAPEAGSIASETNNIFAEAEDIASDAGKVASEAEDIAAVAEDVTAEAEETIADHEGNNKAKSKGKAKAKAKGKNKADHDVPSTGTSSITNPRPKKRARKH